MPSLNPKTFQKRYVELSEWVSEALAHSLAKKISNDDVELLINEFRNIALRARVLEQEGKR